MAVIVVVQIYCLFLLAIVFPCKHSIERTTEELEQAARRKVRNIIGRADWKLKLSTPLTYCLSNLFFFVHLIIADPFSLTRNSQASQERPSRPRLLNQRVLWLDGSIDFKSQLILLSFAARFFFSSVSWAEEPLQIRVCRSGLPQAWSLPSCTNYSISPRVFSFL